MDKKMNLGRHVSWKTGPPGRLLLGLAALVFFCLLAGGVKTARAADASVQVNMYRLYNPNSGEHFYTANLTEMQDVAQAGWRYEGVGWVAPKTSGTPVYRLYNPNAGDHHYTTSGKECNNLISVGWKYEGIGWYSEEAANALPVYRQYNKNAVAGAHNFTTSSAENQTLVNAGWSYEGIAWYAANSGALSIQGRWLVTAAWGSLERYWLAADTTIARNRLITPEEGAGYYAYAKSSGAVVRGTWDNGAGRVYLADNDGRLETASGWLVTSKYSGGLQRYYMDGTMHAACTGSFVVDGNHYWGLANVGYVLRGKLRIGSGMLLADNNGVLAWTEGWLVTDTYDGALQRYRIDTSPGSGLMGAHLGEFTVDNQLYYGLPDQGYVARNQNYKSSAGWYTANNDGVLSRFALSADAVRGYLNSAAGGSTLTSFGGYSLSQGASSALTSAVNGLRSQGYDVGFIMVDVNTGKGIAYNADKRFFSASTVKGPYVASVVSANPSSADTWAGTMIPTIRDSSNQGYTTLRNAFGSGPMLTWCQKAGVDTSLAYSKYPFYSARELAKLWTVNYDYFTWGERGSQISSWFSSSKMSAVYYTLGSSYSVRTKPGWMEPGETYAVTNDGGLVFANNGTYIVAIMTTVPGDANKLTSLVQAIDSAHSEM